MAWQLGDYATLAEVRQTIDPTGEMATTYDDFIQECIHDASAVIDRFTRRWFYEKTETRYFDADYDVDQDEEELILDADLLSITSITVDNGSTTLSASDYVLLPRNYSPKSTIKLRESSTETWSWTTEPEDAIAVAGKWGFNTGTVPPDDVKRACIFMVEWMYHERKNPITGVVVLPNQGGLTIPVDMPAKVTSILQRLRKPVAHFMD